MTCPVCIKSGRRVQLVLVQQNIYVCPNCDIQYMPVRVEKK